MSNEPKNLRPATGETDRYVWEAGWHDLDLSELAEDCHAQVGARLDFLDDAADEMVTILGGYLIAMKAAV